MSGRDAFALSLYGMGGRESENSGNYLNALVDYTEPPLTKEQVKSIGRKYSKAVYNYSQQKWEEKGGANCQ